MAQAKKMRVDFSGVDPEVRKHTDRAVRVPEGDYLVRITDGEVRESERSGGRYINWKAQIVKPEEYKGKTLYGMTSLKKEALWNLRNLIHAATGKNVAGRTVNIDFDVLRGKIVGAVVEDNEFNDKIRSRINTWFDRSEYEEKEPSEEDEDEEEEEEEEEDEDESLDEVDVEDL